MVVSPAGGVAGGRRGRLPLAQPPRVLDGKLQLLCSCCCFCIPSPPLPPRPRGFLSATLQIPSATSDSPHVGRRTRSRSSRRSRSASRRRVSSPMPLPPRGAGRSSKRVRHYRCCQSWARASALDWAIARDSAPRRVRRGMTRAEWQDFSSVMKFGQTQEHALDSDKVKHDTALALTGEVAHHAALKLEARNAAEVSSWMSSGDAL